jgi:FkbH-like protein
VTFLQAKAILREFKGGDALPFLLAMSGTSAPLDLFVRAAAAQRQRAASTRTLAFNTLGQALRDVPVAGEREIFLLMPWDFVREADWRTGLPTGPCDAQTLKTEGQLVADQLARRPLARILYLPAPMPPLLTDPGEDIALATWVHGLAGALGAETLPAEAFALGGYLATGCPITGASMGRVAEHIVAAALRTPLAGRKVLVTDLDNVLWSGVVAEDGIDGIGFRPEGAGYRHFIYQRFLSKLRGEGVLLAAVSRNDEDIALEPLRSGRMPLGESDFVAVLASYGAKSAQIRKLGDSLNLGLDAFVFVDDNKVELAEVRSQLPDVHSLEFPATDAELPGLLRELARLFGRSVVTAEDRERTAMYRRRLQGMPPSQMAGTDLTEFLRDLRMTLTIHDRSRGDRSRVVQLINKTNQFNLNGLRVTDDGVGRILDGGGRLYGASLEDRHGSHGEILACLVTTDGEIVSMVMSCRVFQRRVEHAFLGWLATQDRAPKVLRFAATNRNTPIQEFLIDRAFNRDGNGLVHLDAAEFASTHAADLALFVIQSPGRA